MVETEEPSQQSNSNPPELNESGLPKGILAGYVKGKSCGRGRHQLVVAKTGTYAVCTRCHLIVRRGTKKGGDENAVDSGL